MSHFSDCFAALERSCDEAGDRELRSNDTVLIATPVIEVIRARRG